MYQSSYIKEVLEHIPTPEEMKEIQIKEAVDRILLCETTGRLHFIQGGLVSIFLGICVFLVFKYRIALSSMLPPALAFLLTVLLSGCVVAIAHFHGRYLLLDSSIKLKKLLEDIPYETRMEYTSIWKNKIKIIVEGNITKGSVVIKENSKSFTAYIDLRTSSAHELIKAISEIVQKQESFFDKK